MKTGLLSGILMLFGLIIGCSRHALYTQDDVRKFVLPGTSREAIIKRFGEPIVDKKNPKFEDGSTNIDEILNFSLPTESPPGKLVFSGFLVRFKNGKALDWAPIESILNK